MRISITSIWDHILFGLQMLYFIIRKYSGNIQSLHDALRREGYLVLLQTVTEKWMGRGYKLYCYVTVYYYVTVSKKND